uniref:30S ribosomal protein S18 n=1 Tax=Nephromyces sp. ex Molgula occidentalis TaxID=2544991 RepID=A0A5C1H791_9APIC|nr:hypothetical protein [Nephromyces sp. ex Molgula occidentalis]
MTFTKQALFFKSYLTKNQKLKKRKIIKINKKKYNYIIKFLKYYRFLGIFPFIDNKTLKI